MMRRRRDVSNISLSMLDVIAGAMAAFLIIMVILLPYSNTGSSDQRDLVAHLEATITELQAALATAREAGSRPDQQALVAALQQALETVQARLVELEVEIAAAKASTEQALAEASRQQQRAAALARQLASTFLVLYVRWDTRDDIDLHVIDPSGAEFWWNDHKTIPGRPGELSEDSILGPANEVWEIRDAPPGDYRIEVKLYSIRDVRKPVAVQGRVFHRDGSAVFREARLSRLGQRERIATIRVATSGAVSVH